MASLRGRPLPFLRLRHAFQVDEGPSARELMVVVEGAGREFGLIVDGVTGQGQIVIKPLAKVFQRVRGISAATVLGNGQVALILDVEALGTIANPRGGTAEAGEPAA